MIVVKKGSEFGDMGWVAKTISRAGRASCFRGPGSPFERIWYLTRGEKDQYMNSCQSLC